MEISQLFHENPTGKFFFFNFHFVKSFKGRGVTSIFTATEKKKFISNLKQRFVFEDGDDNDTFDFTQAGEGELADLFGLLPNGTDHWTPEKEELLDVVLSLFEDALDDLCIAVSKESGDRLRRVFFSGKKEIEIDMLNWLFVLLNSYKDNRAIERMAITITKFFTFLELPFPKKLEIILPHLTNFTQSLSKQLSYEEERLVKMKMKALHCMTSSTDENRQMLIDHHIISFILPHICNNRVCSGLLLNLCKTNSCETVKEVIDSAELLSSITNHLKEVVAWNNADVRDERETDDCLSCLDDLVKAMSQCCCRHDRNMYRDDGEQIQHDVNEYAVKQCTAFGIPDLVLRIATDLIPKLPMHNVC
jgi:hypothetical protein